MCIKPPLLAQHPHVTLPALSYRFILAAFGESSLDQSEIRDGMVPAMWCACVPGVPIGDCIRTRRMCMRIYTSASYVSTWTKRKG